MEKANLYFSFIIGFGYIFYTIGGKFSLKPKNQYYNELFQYESFIKNLILTFLIASFGYWRVTEFDARETFYFAPILYLITLRTTNLLSLILNKRNLIIATRWDNPPKGKNGINWIDRLLGFFTLFIPIIVCGLLMNKLRFGTFFVN